MQGTFIPAYEYVISCSVVNKSEIHIKQIQLYCSLTITLHQSEQKVILYLVANSCFFITHSLPQINAQLLQKSSAIGAGATALQSPIAGPKPGVSEQHFILTSRPFLLDISRRSFNVSLGFLEVPGKFQFENNFILLRTNSR